MKLSTFIIRFSIYVVLAAILIPLGRHLSRPSLQEGGAPLVVYCAAGVKAPVYELARQYEAEFGKSIQLQYGGSGTLLANIEIAGSGDLYIAADASWIERARSKGMLADVLPLGRQAPVVLVKKGNPLGIASIGDLTSDTVRVACGNPGASAIGQVTRRVYEDAGLWDAFLANVESRGVFKPTVPDVALDVVIGTVDAGIVWGPTAAQHPQLETIHLPELDAQIQDISVGVLNSAASATDALHFARFLSSPRANRVFVAHHYGPVVGAAWVEDAEMKDSEAAESERLAE